MREIFDRAFLEVGEYLSLATSTLIIQFLKLNMFGETNCLSFVGSAANSAKSALSERNLRIEVSHRTRDYKNQVNCNFSHNILRLGH
jgi:hypothetical protein